MRMTPDGRRLLRVVVIGTLPAVAFGLTLRSQLERLNDTPRAVAVALFAARDRSPAHVETLQGDGDKRRRLRPRRGGDRGRPGPRSHPRGVTRSGMTIAVGTARSLSLYEAARFAFLLGIPVIAGTGLLQLVELARQGRRYPGRDAGRSRRSRRGGLRRYRRAAASYQECRDRSVRHLLHRRRRSCLRADLTRP